MTYDYLKLLPKKDQIPDPGETPSGNVPEGFYFNPDTGQMTSRELQKEHYMQTLPMSSSVPMMAAHGGSLGTSDEAAYLGGYLAGGPELAHALKENQRAKIDAAREKFPKSSLASEIGGGMLVPSAVLRQAAAKNFTTAMAKGAGSGAGVGALYAAGEAEGDLSDRAKQIPMGAGVGAAGGIVGVPAGKLAGWALGKLGKAGARIFASKKFYNEQTGLTKEGAQALRTLGADLDELSADFQKQFQVDLDAGMDPATAAARAEMGQFGIPAYRHNITGDVNDFADFERARRGAAGDQAKAQVVPAAQGQQQAAREAADDLAVRVGGGVRGDQLDAATAVTNRLDEIRTAEKSAAQAAYKAADDAGVTVPGDLVSGVKDRVSNRLTNENIVLRSGLYPKAEGYLKTLEAMSRGEGNVSLSAVDSMRKAINRAFKGATPEDERALSIVKDEYDNWIDAIVETRLFDGGEEGFEALSKARALWRDYAQKFQGKDAGSKFLQDMVDQDVSPEQAVNWLYGGAKLGGGRMNSKIAGYVKETLGADSPEWAALRQGFVRKLTQKPGTEDVTTEGAIAWGPQKVSSNINTFLNSPATRSMSEALFTKAERNELAMFAKALNRMVPPEGAVNYSGTAYENSRLMQRAWQGIMSAIGGATGGPGGAVMGNEGAKALSGGRSWLAGRKLVSQPALPRPIGAPQAGAVGAVSATDNARNLLFPSQQEQGRRP